VATIDPGDLASLRELKVLTRKKVRPLLGVPPRSTATIVREYPVAGVDRNVRSFEETLQAGGISGAPPAVG